ncbi:MAG: DUF3592 domain-containing protein [Akkermansiaceae bacterium]
MLKISQKLIVLTLLTIAWIATIVSYLSIKAKYSGIEHWPSVPATIIENTSETVTKRVDSEYYGTKYYKTRIGKVTFEYTVNNQKYLAERASPNHSYLYENTDTANPTAYYNPKNNNIAVLINEKYDGEMLLGLIFTIPMFTIAFWLIMHCIFRTW